MALDFFKTLPKLRIAPGDLIEVERAEDEGWGYYFGEYVSISKKNNLYVKMHQFPQTGMTIGEEVVLSNVSSEFYQATLSLKIKSWKSHLLHILEKGEEINCIFSYPQEIEIVELPKNYEGVVIPLTAPSLNLMVNYRAMQSAHLQNGPIQEVWKDGLTILTNVSIPEGTNLIMEIDLPFPKTVSLRGQVTKSQRSGEHKKFMATIEFKDALLTEVESLMLYVLFSFRRLDKHADEWHPL